MKVLVDTSVWSSALRKQQNPIKSQKTTLELAELIRDSRVVIIGVIRQELLSGIKSIDQFDKLKSYLKAFPDILLETKDFEFAAELFNQGRSHGIQGSHIDFLIAAAAIHREIPIFTLDRDFEHYARFAPLQLFHFDKNGPHTVK